MLTAGSATAGGVALGGWLHLVRAACERRRSVGRARRGPRDFPRISQCFFDRLQPAGMHQPQQSHLQMQPRLQRALQIAKQVQRQLQIARQILFAERRRGLRQFLLLGLAMRPPAWSRRPRSSPPADCGNSAPAPARNAAGCGRWLRARPPRRASAANRPPPAPARPRPANRARTCPAARALRSPSSFVPQHAMA